MTYSAAVLADTPLGYWPLSDHNEVSTIGDLSGHSYSGLVTGHIQLDQPGATPELGSSAYFPYGVGYITVPGLDGHLPTGGQPYTIECWAKVVPTDWGTFVFWGDYTFLGTGTYAFNALLCDATYNLRAVWSGNDFGWGASLVVPQNFDDWHHVALTCDGVSDALYVDGCRVRTAASYAGAYLGHNFHIGSFPLQSQTLTGWLQHVAVYNHALSAEQLAVHYASAFPYQRTVLGAAPAAYWPLSEKQGPAWADISGHNYSVSSPPDPQPGVAGPLAGTNAVRFRLGGAVGGTQSGLGTHPPFTVDCWLKLDLSSDPRGSGYGQALLAWGDPQQLGYGSASPALDVVTLKVVTTTAGDTYLYANTTGTGLGLWMGTTHIAGGWHHIALTWDGTGTVIPYTDGVAGTSLVGADNSAALASPSSGSFFIGGFPGGDDVLTWGDIAYVALYPSALSGARIAAHHSAGTGGGSPYYNAVLADSPLAWWPLNDGSPGAIDTSGSGLTLTAIGSGITTGQAGPGSMSAMHFDGSSRLERDGSTSLPSGQAPWTLECWVRRDGSGGNNMLVQIGDRHAFGSMYTLHGDSPTGVNPYWGSYDLHIGGLPSQVTAWRHYVVTFNGLRRTVYLDGVVVGADGSDQTGEVFTNNKISIGAQDGGGDGWVGSLCQVAVYDHVLSSGRVSAHYSAMSGSGAPDGPYRTAVLADSPSGFWPLQET